MFKRSTTAIVTMQGKYKLYQRQFRFYLGMGACHSEEYTRLLRKQKHLCISLCRYIYVCIYMYVYINAYMCVIKYEYIMMNMIDIYHQQRYHYHQYDHDSRQHDHDHDHHRKHHYYSSSSSSSSPPPLPSLPV